MDYNDSIAETGTEDVVADPIEPIINANQFSGISSDELFAIMGEAPADNWNFDSPNGQAYKATTYEYEVDGLHYEFLVIDSKVVRLTCYSEKYFDSNGDSFSYLSEKDALALFGISSYNYRVASRSANVLRLHYLSDTIEDFWIPSIDFGHFDEVKITFDYSYFSEF